jgi:hypothetical protein
VGAGDSWLAGALYENLAVREVGAEKCSAVLSGEASMLDDPGFRTAAEKMNELFRTEFWAIIRFRSRIPTPSAILSTERRACCWTGAGPPPA